MNLSNLHTHTNYVDGANTPQEMLLSAIGKGFASLGFSEHAYTGFDSSCCLTPETTQAYFEEIRALQAQYQGQIDVYLGLEIDWLEPLSYPGLDYFIGSVHALRLGDTYYTVDNTPKMLADCITHGYSGNGAAMAKAYFHSVAEMAQTLRPPIVGHFDLVCKFNRNGRYFDESGKAYQSAALEALDAVIETGGIIEVNTGGMARGYRDTPYPKDFLLRRIHEKHAPIILSADAHAAGHIDFAFAETSAMLKGLGFQTQMTLTKNGFQETAL